MSPRATKASRGFLCRIALGLAAVFVITGPACLSSEELGKTDFTCPTQDGFRVVSQVIERRCGTIDCHGDESRTFRVYGRTGLRLPQSKDDYLASRFATSGAATTVAGAGGGGDTSAAASGAGGGPFGEYVTGGTEPTSDAEIAANRLSACGVEPDLMSQVVAGKAEPDTLTLVRKPRLTEAHKGGLLWKADSALGDKCLLSWIAGSVETNACAGELKRP